MKNLFAAILFMSSLNSFAGKEERERRKEIEPNLAKASADFKAACGCPLKIEVKWDSYTVASQMARIPTTAEGISAGSVEYCKTADDKKAICQMKTLELSFSADPKDIRFEKGTMFAQTNDMLHGDWPQMTKILDK